MAVQWGLSQPQGGGFDYLESLQALGQQQLQQQAIQQRQYGFDRQVQQDADRTGLAARARTGDFAGARQEAALGGDFDFANALGSLDDDKIKRLGVELDAIGTLVPQLRALPADQRATVGTAALARVGFSPQELQAMDWTDAGLEAAYTMSASGKAALAARMKAAEPRVVGDGGALVDGAGKVLYENQREEKPIWDAEGGNLIYPSRYAGGGSAAPTASGGGSRAARNNNPGNIIDSAFARSQPGYQGSDGRFARFASAEAGAGAQAALLGSYIDRGFNTVEKIINRWAPPSENDTDAYVRNVAKALGVSPGQTLGKDAIPALQRIITRVEGGPGGSSAGGNRPASQPGVVNVRPPKVKEGYRMLSAQEAQQRGLDTDTKWQLGPSGQITSLAAKGDKPLTEGQAKAVGYLESARAAAMSLNALRGYKPSEIAYGLGELSAGNPLKRNLSQVDRRALNGQLAFATAVLRLESGAVVGKEEAASKAQTLFPMPGDGPEVQADKRQQRNAAIRALRTAAGPGGASVPTVALVPDKAEKPARGGAIKLGQSSQIGGFTVTRVK